MIKASRDSNIRHQSTELETHQWTCHTFPFLSLYVSHVIFTHFLQNIMCPMWCHTFPSKHCVPCDSADGQRDNSKDKQLTRSWFQKINNLHAADFRGQTTYTQLILEDKQLTCSWFQKTNNLHTADFRRQTTYTQLTSEDKQLTHSWFQKAGSWLRDRQKV